MIKKLTLIALFASGIALTGTSYGASLASDNASDTVYDDSWASGDNGGTGFGAWTLTNEGANSGHFIGDSTTLNTGNTGADINTSLESFGMFGHSGETSNATRFFTGVLSVGDTFSIDIAVNFRNGAKGFDLLDGSTSIFNLNIGADDYVVNNATTGNGSIGSTYDSNTKFNISVTQTTGTGGTWTITRSGGVSDSDSGTYTGVGSGFKLYESQTTGGGAAADNLYANNMSIIPEPSTVSLLIGSSVLGGLFLLRRKRA